MTKKETIVALKNYFETGSMGELTNEDAIAFCDKEIAALERKAEKAREAAEKRKNEGDALTAAILEVLTDELASIPDITLLVQESDPEATVGKIQYRLNQMAKLETPTAEKGEIVIEGGEGTKSRKVVAYKRVG